MIDVVNGNPRIRSWPKKRGAPKTAEHQAQVDFFRHASWATKFMHPDMNTLFMEWRKGTALLPRDLAFMMFANTMFIIPLAAGKVLYPMQIVAKVSESLDALSQTPGKMLIRGTQFWEETDPPRGLPWWWATPDPSGFTLVSGDATNLAFNYDPAKGLSVNCGISATPDRMRLALRPIPSPTANWQLDYHHDVFMTNANAVGVGTFLRHAASGRVISFYCENSQRISVTYWNSLTSFNSQPSSTTFAVGCEPRFLRIQKIGANLVFSVSPDGVTYIGLFAASATAWFASPPDLIGFGVLYNRAGGPNTLFNVNQWVFT